ncbi:5-formyltetrahydrofolate cyclo-ligase [Myxozyma melibiosi]|uniref:5-formyltetrahydrofolate cyclo-ligase n=1 Tax=Myxozyma melibiosi TaxID=54550 RepID=A0ABR1F1L2_9ASCO
MPSTASVERAAITARKQAARKIVSDRLRLLPYESIADQSRTVADTIRKLPEYQDARNIGLYMHMEVSTSVPRKSGRSVEVQTDLMIQNAFEDGKSVFLPRIVPDSELTHGLKDLFYKTLSHQQDSSESIFTPKSFLKMLKMPDYASVAELKTENDAHSFIIREPPTENEDAFEGDGLDIIIVPGLVFNESCDRIGRGKGFYDTYIGLHNAWSDARENASKPLLVGIALREQIIQRLESESELPREEHDQILDILVVESDIHRRRR